MQPDKSFFPTDGEGTWDSGMIVYWSDVVYGDEVLFYCGGWNRAHGSNEGAAARRVRLRFHLTGRAKLYAFEVTRN